MYGAVCWSISQLVNDWTRSILQFWYNIALSLQDISSLCYVVASTRCLFWYFKSRRCEVFWTIFFLFIVIGYVMLMIFWLMIINVEIMINGCTQDCAYHIKTGWRNRKAVTLQCILLLLPKAPWWLQK